MLLVLPVWLYVAIGLPRLTGPRQHTGAWLRRAIRTSLPATAVTLAGFGYNLWLSGSVLGTAEQRNANWTAIFGARNMWDGHVGEGLVGLLVSPSRGLLIYSPIVLLAGVGAWRAWQRLQAPAQADHVRLVRGASVACAIGYLAYAKYLLWWGGHAYGPRYLTDVLPFACVLMAMGLEVPLAGAARQAPRLGRGPAWAWVLLCGYSVAVQLIGAFCWPSAREGTIDLAYYQSLWDWRHAQIVSCLESGPQFDPVGLKLLARVGLHVAARPKAMPE